MSDADPAVEAAPTLPPISPAQVTRADPPIKTATRDDDNHLLRVAEPVSARREATTGNLIDFPQSASASSCVEKDRNGDESASASSFPVNAEPNDFIPSLFGVIKPRVWQSKQTVKNPNYPRVTSPGCYFIEHSGGFQLILRATSKYLGHYTRAAIAELEKKYGKKKRITNRQR